MPTTEQLLGPLREGAEPSATLWLEQALAHAARGTESQLLGAYTGASKHLGRRPIEVGDADGTITGWAAEDAGRLLLLLTRAAEGGHDVEADAGACFEQGDTRERHSWLRGVASLPEPERFLPLVVDACRTNILTLFQAVACENPYPARYFPERNFNQLVMKALFNGVSLARIEGLAARANPELTRMAGDFADERRAAGRPVPADIALAMAAPPTQRTP